MHTKRFMAFGFAALALVAAHRAEAATGDPVGNFEAASVSLISGWTFDPDTTSTNPGGNGGPTTPTPTVVLGCTDPKATNYDSKATQDDGSCKYQPAEPCVARYRWVNVGSSGTIDQDQGCKAAGAISVAYSSTGICASGEDRPNAGYDYQKIDYARGTWGGGNGGGGTTVPFQNNGYRCYMDGQKWDKDNTDIAIAYYCDFGNTYPDTCPVTYIPPVKGSTGGSDYKNTKDKLNFKGFFDAILALVKPYPVSAASSQSNSVEIYDGPKGSGVLLAVVPANQPRSDVNAVMSVSGDHGFSWAPTDAVKDGNPHDIYVYGTDIEAPGQTTLLSGSPRTIQSAPNVTNSSPSRATLSCPANGSLTNTSLQVSFRSSDADGDGIRYLIDWDGNGTVDEIVPAGGAYATQNTTQSSSKSWSLPGQKTVIVTAQDSNGANAAAASCSFTLVDSATPPDGNNNGGGGNGRGGNGGNGGPGNGAQKGFTVSGDKSRVQLQFLGSLSGTSEPVRIEANSFGGFSAPITLRLVSVLSTSSGASLPQGTVATASFDDQPFTSAPTTIQTYDASIGRYRGASGVIGSSFKVSLSKAVTETYVATIEGSSGSATALFQLVLDPKATAPSFNEI